MQYALIIEWPSDAGEAPEVFVGPDLHALQAQAILLMQRALGDQNYEDDPDFVTNHPYPDVTDAVAVQEWMEALRDATTAPWVTLFELYTDDGVTSRGVQLPLRMEHRGNLVTRPYERASGDPAA